MSMKKVIEQARQELGVTEEPAGSNRVKYWEEYGAGMQGQPWCVAFLWWVFHRAGESAAFFGGGRTASCRQLLGWYASQGLTFPAEAAQPGDIALLSFDGSGDVQHCGLILGSERGEDGRLLRVRTVEGNTSPGDAGSPDNGGCVAEKLRYPRHIVRLCRPRYQPEEGQADDVAGHWAEESIRRVRAAGLMQGYPDGSFRPDRPVTRAELAVILNRWEESK